MPVGPFPTFEACLADPKLRAAYPDDDARRRVCGGMEKHTRDLSPARKLFQEDAGLMGAEVIEGPSWWLVKGNTAAREGVNANGQLKPWEDLEASVATLDGVPFVWDHPHDGAFVKDPLAAAGVLVNTRARQDRTLGYDLMLWKKAPAGHRTSALDLERNELAVHLIQSGVAIHNSGGYAFIADDKPGEWRQHDGTTRPYRTIQRGIHWDHVAGLAPIIPSPGACPVGDGCGIGIRPAADGEACAHGGGCCKDRAKAAIQRVAKELGVTEAEALAAIVMQARRG